MTGWHKALAPQTRSLHVFVRSKLIAMSVSVVNMLTGGMLRPYTNRAAFDAAIAAAVSRA
jgi:hypothetical protein